MIMVIVMEMIYNKLVRDNIPNIIKENGSKPFIRKLTDTEYKKELENKLLEKYNDVISSRGKHRIEELADMYEVIRTIAEVEGSSIEKVVDVANSKRRDRGAFYHKVFLEKVVE